ncbi:NAD(P) transhydrogenase subunit alpha [Sphingomonadales bacterium 56]|uniref:NAD(P) transhydrogenase subunit alpha n=1 Tax=unclassified Sphingobium TaxID=2611147 RepID=UPI001917D7AE|nr:MULTISPECIES: NAD(P) transhydrogenase subunit alpha [unclassified Sphingobium]MBY2930438.1 NAD(P) transhydrogenase subunit alpha [Sphingomonadales bacterium 56]MBY2960548.1 NAD(P) transhydrogenase subunit alpha [Sphingomonadales bacterium 58]CAD7341308.1 NAD(P) transhydrogenase subunit alpha part 1 [Sphingobium sp. S6]CAD7341423.1 NAD(P) transhydrogenase subunit alpha part 1 [Sphingobium sp. S8]
MVKISVLANQVAGEHRTAITPSIVARYTKLGLSTVVESGAGSAAGFLDEAYAAQGASIVDRKEALAQADVLVTVRPPVPADLMGVRKGTKLIGGLAPFADPARIAAYAELGVEAMALELLPRTTRAQAMDILSSQANLAGYHAVARATTELNRCLPMMTTAAGSIAAAKAFVMGVGVAGLQAIATARRLGAVVSATDVRPETREQIMSLGAKPIFEEIQDGDQLTAAVGGYAGEMSEAYRQRQAALVSGHIAQQDMVITTALIPGRPAPRLISDAQIASMKPGSVVVDLAAESGGNVEGAIAGEMVMRHGVKIIGLVDGPSQVAVDASNLFARNCYNFIEAYWDKSERRLAMPTDDALIEAVTLTRHGEIVHPRFVQAAAA